MNEYVESKVNAPGLGLLVVGILSVLGNIAGLAWQLITAIPAVISAVQSGVGMDYWIAFATGQGWSLVMSLIGFFVAFVVIFAGLRLRSARSAGIVYAGSIMAALPCCLGFPCCCIGLPVGIWAIVTMQDEQVKSAFSE